jgi:hypothetical protein
MLICVNSRYALPVSFHSNQVAAIPGNCLQRLSGALRAGCILAASCGIAVGTRAHASALVIRETSIYKVVEGPSWTQAESSAVRIGGHLAAITTQSEQDFIRLAPFPSNLSLWIGLSDKDAEGTWKWTNGEVYEYSFWSSENPSNSGSGEDYVNLMPIDGYTWDHRGPQPREWNDWDENDPRATHGIAEIPFQSFNGNAYVRVQGLILSEAVANALELGGTIVDNSSPIENAWLATSFAGEPIDRIARIPLAVSVPAPLPLAGATATFGFSRKLKRRIAASRKVV